MLGKKALERCTVVAMRLNHLKNAGFIEQFGFSYGEAALSIASATTL